MRTTKTFTITIELDDDPKNPIKHNDLFYFEQSLSGLPTIYRHQGRKGEDWDGYTISKTGEKAYLKVVGISGLLLRPFCANGEALLNSDNPDERSVATEVPLLLPKLVK